MRRAPSACADAPALRVQGYATVQDKPLFSLIDFLLPAGRWTCLLGPSGGGKSTILRQIAGLKTGAKFEGHITIQSPKNGQRRLAYMAQDDLLFPWLNVRDNITLGAKLRGEKPVNGTKLSTIMAQMGLMDHAHKKPSALSGGQRQRVALARTLIEDCPIVLLDEPFSALDAKTRADMQDLAHTVLQGRTVLFVTHDPAEAARLADTAFILWPSGLSKIELPNTPAPRDGAAKTTLHCQADLLCALRAGAPA